MSVFVLAFLAGASAQEDAAPQDEAPTRDEDAQEGDPQDEDAPQDEAPPPGEDPPQGEPISIDLSTDRQLRSALDAIEGLDQAVEAGLEDWAALSRKLGRARWASRPELAVSILQGEPSRWAPRVGATFTHQWWPLGDAAIQIGGTTELTALFPVGGARGRRFVLRSTVGPWLGPVGLRVGPVLRSDRTDWRVADRLLDDALLVGAGATVTLAAGPIRPTAGIELGVLAAGPRGPADPQTAPLPLIGDETGYSVGLAWMGRPLTVNVHTTLRQTEIGSEIDARLGVGLQL